MSLYQIKKTRASPFDFQLDINESIKKGPKIRDMKVHISLNQIVIVS
jgi:hypothetical protein